ncbi:MAG: hypothetical protein KAR05_02870, partial [Candidatus Omnitrophica bacterium]|nr:hypothetical protein [Candidatus Omnitrophota bacterium]
LKSELRFCPFLQFRKYKTFQTAENSFPENVRSYDDRREEFFCISLMLDLCLLLALQLSGLSLGARSFVSSL